MHSWPLHLGDNWRASSVDTIVVYAVSKTDSTEASVVARVETTATLKGLEIGVDG
jgi:hypothetical protein